MWCIDLWYCQTWIWDWIVCFSRDKHCYITRKNCTQRQLYKKVDTFEVEAWMHCQHEEEIVVLNICWLGSVSMSNIWRWVWSWHTFCKVCCMVTKAFQVTFHYNVAATFFFFFLEFFFSFGLYKCNYLIPQRFKILHCDSSIFKWCNFFIFYLLKF